MDWVRFDMDWVRFDMGWVRFDKGWVNNFLSITRQDLVLFKTVKFERVWLY